MGLFGRKRFDGPAAPSVAAAAVTLDGKTHVVRQVVNVLGDSCPRPQLMTKKALGNATPGDVIEIMVDNPTSMEALPPLAPDFDSTHLATLKEERCWRVFFRRN
jgi:tRNA 2-thiouridine synthesizing protein A